MYWLGFVMRIHFVFCEVGTIVIYYLDELWTLKGYAVTVTVFYSHGVCHRLVRISPYVL